MPAETKTKKGKTVGYIILGVLVIVLLLVVQQIGKKRDLETTPKPPAPPQKEDVPTEKPVMDYNQLQEDKQLSALMQERKAKYGIENGVDMVVKSNESLKIGDETVAMEDIIDETRLKRGEIVEKEINRFTAKAKDGDAEDFGIHIVQPGDNIWNIHFKLLKDYFDRKHIALSPMADEPKQDGFSTGVGKILKFSENMVYIYNVKDRTLDTDINLIHPLSKIVVYRMGEVFSLLDQLDYTNVNRIQFDGETLWVPAER